MVGLFHQSLGHSSLLFLAYPPKLLQDDANVTKGLGFCCVPQGVGLNNSPIVEADTERGFIRRMGNLIRRKSMPYVKRIVCLANSRKTSGRCIAGKEFKAEGQFGGWIRPVSDRLTQELSERECKYGNGGEPKLLEIIDIPTLCHQPHAHQIENHLINPRRYWTRKGRITWNALRPAIDRDAGSVWGTGNSSYNGRNDRLSEEEIEIYKGSLLLLEPEQFVLVVAEERTNLYHLRRRVRAEFVWKQAFYRLSVTDPVIEKQYLAMPNGKYTLKDVVACFSVGHPHTDGMCYKFCAGIMIPERVQS